MDSDYVTIDYTYPESDNDKPVVTINGDLIYVTPAVGEDIEYYRLYIEGVYPDTGYWAMIDGNGENLQDLMSDEITNFYRIESGTYKIYVQGCNDLTDYRTDYSSFVEYNFVNPNPAPDYD